MKNSMAHIGDFSVHTETEEVFCIIPPFLAEDYKKQDKYPWFVHNKKIFCSMDWLIELCEPEPVSYDGLLKRKAEVLEKYRYVKDKIIEE